MSNSLPQADVVIIGLGAAGGIASYVLTKAGLNVVGIEAGSYATKADFLSEYDELQGWSFRNALGKAKVNDEVPTWRPNAQAPVQAPPVPPFLMANGVGGSSVHYSAQSWRYRSDDFKIRSTTIAKYGKDALPAGTAITDWPLSYDELEPYYENVEKLTGISGQGGANVFESPRKSDYPMPPLRPTDYTNLAGKAMTRLGYNPFPQPSAILSEAYDGRPACSYCGYCTGFGCWNDSKSSTLVSAIAEAEKTGKLEIRANSRVTKIMSNDAGKATGVEYIDAQGDSQVQPAAIVIVASYVFENNRLLFLSATKDAPHGLGNNKGQLGKHYAAHLFIISNGLFPDQHINTFGGALTQGVAMDDFNGDNFDHAGLGFIRGSLIFPYGNAERLPISASRGLAPDAPQWGSGYKRWLKDNALSVGGVMGQGEFLPYENNYLDLDPKTKDDKGVPVVRITFNTFENEVKQAAFMTKKQEEILKQMGASQVWSYPAGPTPVDTHAYGGTRMGNDPTTSVVDSFGRMHDVSNLAIMGGSVFFSTSGYNPTLTIQALAWRGAEHIAKNFDSLAV